MRQSNVWLVGVCGILLCSTSAPLVTAQPAQPSEALTAAEATACIQTAILAQPGMITEMEAEKKGTQRLCEIKLVAADGKKYELSIDVTTNQVLKTK